MFLLLILLLFLFGLIILLSPRLITGLFSQTRTYEDIDVPQAKTAIVFGAGLWRDGSPTPVLRDRVATAANLYFNSKVDTLLMSGDNLTDNYNEPGAMRSYALDLGVPDEAIIIDDAGSRTFDTCYRAKNTFEIDAAILVTQKFHLPRALYTCNQLGLSATGVPADGRVYRRLSLVFWNLRELPATLVALWEIHISHPPQIG